MSTTAVILDTNIFVAAGFNPNSTSARILNEVRSGRLRLIWSDPTRREVQHILERIPPLSWSDVASLFREEDRHHVEASREDFGYIPDPDDRKFASLARATGAILLTSDDDLLRGREQAGLEILTPAEYWTRQQS